MLAVAQPIARWMESAGLGVPELARAAGMDAKLVKAIAGGNFTPSPAQRQRLAEALGISPGEIVWHHAIGVEHLRGNGPQCGRST
jgi:transcriptional regulator with XRE-family HTH domain